MKIHKAGVIGTHIIAAEPPKPSFIFSVNSPSWIMKITPEGKLEFGEGLSPEEAAQKAAKLLLDFWNQQRGLARTDELLEANSRYLLRARASEEYLAEAIARLEPVSSADLKFLQDAEKHLKAPWL
jgi:hypothetical protein